MRMQRILDYGAQFLRQNMNNACTLQKGSSVLDVALEGVVEDEMSKPVCATQPSQIAGPLHEIPEGLYYIAMFVWQSCAYQDESHHHGGAFLRRADAIRHRAGAIRHRAGAFPRRAGAIRHREEEVSWQTFPACTACVDFVGNAAIEFDKVMTPQQARQHWQLRFDRKLFDDYTMNDVLYPVWRWMV